MCVGDSRPRGPARALLALPNTLHRKSRKHGALYEHDHDNWALILRRCYIEYLPNKTEVCSQNLEASLYSGACGL